LGAASALVACSADKNKSGAAGIPHHLDIPFTAPCSATVPKQKRPPFGGRFVRYSGVMTMTENRVPLFRNHAVC
jgi:hypothetical protein